MWRAVITHSVCLKNSRLSARRTLRRIHSSTSQTRVSANSTLSSSENLAVGDALFDFRSLASALDAFDYSMAAD